VAAAKGLAQALGLGVVCATSLEVLGAGAVAAGHCGLVLACVDARRGEVFASVRELGRSGETIAEPVPATLFAPDDLAAVLARLGGAPVCAVGDGAQRYAEVLTTVQGVDVVTPALAFPPPSALLHLGLVRLGRGESPVDAASVVPLYMRDADAKSNFARARA
jgi:tRNA threonylcarbamoyl adenosine modification protein YeaZ